MAIESFTNFAIEQEKDIKEPLWKVRGMIDGATFCRDMLTIESAESEAW